MRNGKGRQYCYREILPFAAMVIVECANVGNSTLFKAASDQGMSFMVFVVYSFGLCSLALIPIAFIFHRNTPLPRFTLPVFGRVCLLGVLGFAAQMLGCKGLEYGSPTLSYALSNLLPAFTFALAIIFRMEKLDLKSFTSQAKILGTLVSISGALVVVLYKGLPVIRTSSQYQSLKQPVGLVSSQSNWALGGLLLALDYLVLSIWYIVQTQTVKMYPAEFLVVLFYTAGVTIVSAPVCFFLEPDLKTWSISTTIMLISLLYAAIIGTGFGTVVHTWGLKVKGPVYVALFRPLSIAIAAFMGVVFLGDTLYLGSVIGAILISIGFYVVSWGKAQEEMSEDGGVLRIESAASENVPLLG
ncbi:WAT1-related protein At5g40230-like [Coffea eugenioides]|uniref:WAT1-related protein At5g40230-like n=1 Tax=Coffea eugenioides TaxID=49369 RepID=UPI000F611383|nr:WAT1-related protein At5g40230-like [Coffea eugenioides]